MVCVSPSEMMIGGAEALAAGLPLAIFACDGNEYECENHVHFFVNEDGTRGAINEAEPLLDEEAAALAFVRRDQGYGAE